MDQPLKRPRNRQPRPGQQNRNPRGGGKPQSFSRRPGVVGSGTPQQRAGTVPPARDVVPGAAVFIVLKQDQPTGRETKGVVQDVLTSGDHPRGVKVRLRDGQVGRVQRMDGASEMVTSLEDSAVGVPSRVSLPSGGSGGGYRGRNRFADVRNDEQLDGPPARTLADYMTHLDGFS